MLIFRFFCKLLCAKLISNFLRSMTLYRISEGKKTTKFFIDPIKEFKYNNRQPPRLNFAFYEVLSYLCI